MGWFDGFKAGYNQGKRDEEERDRKEREHAEKNPSKAGKLIGQAEVRTRGARAATKKAVVAGAKWLVYGKKPAAASKPRKRRKAPATRTKVVYVLEKPPAKKRRRRKSQDSGSFLF